MASAAIGTKRSFSTMSHDGVAPTSTMQDTSQGMFASRLRNIVSAEGSRMSASNAPQAQ
jgi:hypothetical protein